MTRHAVPAATAAVLAAFSLLALSAISAPEARAQAWADDHRWSVMPQPERDQPGVERAGTLRVVRFNFDGSDPWRDQGTVIGWANAAAQGRVATQQ